MKRRKNKSISDATDYETNITISKVNKPEKPKTFPYRHQLSLPSNKDGGNIYDGSRSPRRLSLAITGYLDQTLPALDHTKELDYIWNLIKTQQVLSSWVKNDLALSKTNSEILNHETNSIQKYFQRIDFPRVNYEMLDKTIKQVVGRKFANFYLEDKGSLFSSGKNIWGVLGRDGSKIGFPFFTQRPIDISSDSDIKTVSSGIAHGVMLTDNNELYTWGHNNLGQLGYNFNETKIITKSEFNFETGDFYSYTYSPEIVPFFHKNNRSLLITKVSWGNNFTVVVTSSGKLYGWGDNTFNQLAIDNDKSPIIHESDQNRQFYVEEPVPINCYYKYTDQYDEELQEEAKIDTIVWGSEYTYAISQTSKIYFWGRSCYGLNLKPNSSIEASPLHLRSLDSKKITTLSTYENHVLALGHSLRMTFTHPEKPGEMVIINGIPYDDEPTEIEYNTECNNCQIYLINDYQVPNKIMKGKTKKLRRRSKFWYFDVYL